MLEAWCELYRGMGVVRGRGGTGLDDVTVVVPDRKVTHQSISSARKSLVDAGLVYAFGVEIHEGRRHNIWKVNPHVSAR